MEPLYPATTNNMASTTTHEASCNGIPLHFFIFTHFFVVSLLLSTGQRPKQQHFEWKSETTSMSSVTWLGKISPSGHTAVVSLPWQLLAANVQIKFANASSVWTVFSPLLQSDSFELCGKILVGKIILKSRSFNGNWARQSTLKEFDHQIHCNNSRDIFIYSIWPGPWSIDLVNLRLQSWALVARPHR